MRSSDAQRWKRPGEGEMGSADQRATKAFPSVTSATGRLLALGRIRPINRCHGSMERAGFGARRKLEPRSDTILSIALGRRVSPLFSLSRLCARRRASTSTAPQRRAPPRHGCPTRPPASALAVSETASRPPALSRRGDEEPTARASAWGAAARQRPFPSGWGAPSERSSVVEPRRGEPRGRARAKSKSVPPRRRSIRSRTDGGSSSGPPSKPTPDFAGRAHPAHWLRPASMTPLQRTYVRKNSQRDEPD